MKGGTCDIKCCNSKKFKYVSDFFTIEKLELINEKWKSQTMISLSIQNRFP